MSSRIVRRAIHMAMAAATAALLHSCFTGVESTPRIGAGDVRRQQAAIVTDEQLFLDGLAATPPRQWKAGRRLLVDDDRIGLVLTSPVGEIDSLVGRMLIYEGHTPATSLMGMDATDIRFYADMPAGKTPFLYRLALDSVALDTISALAVPFTVDLDLVERVDSMMRGKRLFVRTPMWYMPGARHAAVNGLRHVPVVVDSVVAGDSNYPLAVIFTLDDPQYAKMIDGTGAPVTRMVYMTVGRGRAATRNFDTLFAFADPRRSYPGIKDDVWIQIVQSRLASGMTRDECRLALGAPTTIRKIPTPGGLVENWQYSDGVYLYFEDGYLTRFRQ